MMEGWSLPSNANGWVGHLADYLYSGKLLLLCARWFHNTEEHEPGTGHSVRGHHFNFFRLFRCMPNNCNKSSVRVFKDEPEVEHDDDGVVGRRRRRRHCRIMMLYFEGTQKAFARA